MNHQRDLLPWILGGVSAMAVAVAVTVVSTGRPASSTPAPPTTTAPALAPARVSAPVPTPVVTPAHETMPQADPAAAQPTARDPIPVSAGQIWQCTTNGIKTFSNNPCGRNSSLLDIGPINTMPPPPVMNYARSYAPQPRYVPASDERSDDADQDAYGDEPGAESAGNSYTVIQGIRLQRRRRPGHAHRPPSHHSSAPVSRRN